MNIFVHFIFAQPSNHRIAFVSERVQQKTRSRNTCFLVCFVYILLGNIFFLFPFVYYCSLPFLFVWLSEQISTCSYRRWIANMQIRIFFRRVHLYLKQDFGDELNYPKLFLDCSFWNAMEVFMIKGMESNNRNPQQTFYLLIFNSVWHLLNFTPNLGLSVSIYPKLLISCNNQLF